MASFYPICAVGGGIPDVASGDFQTASFNSALAVVNDGVQDVIAAGELSITLTNPSATEPMGVLLQYIGPRIIIDHDAYVGSFSGNRQGAVDVGQVGNVTVGYDLVTPAPAGGLSVEVPPLVFMDGGTIAPGASQAYEVTETLSFLGDGNPHTAIAGFAHFIGIGVVTV